MENKSKRPEPERVYEVKDRKCLKCQQVFKSSWPGERVCKKCKLRMRWRGG